MVLRCPCIYKPRPFFFFFKFISINQSSLTVALTDPWSVKYADGEFITEIVLQSQKRILEPRKGYGIL